MSGPSQRSSSKYETTQRPGAGTSLTTAEHDGANEPEPKPSASGMHASDVNGIASVTESHELSVA